MSDYTKVEIELCFIRTLSTHGNQIGKSQNAGDRRERIRQAIYYQAVQSHRFADTSMTNAEAFLECYGERLDRRAMLRPIPDEDGKETDE